MPDPTLTRYTTQLWDDARLKYYERDVYVCEEADRLIQALRQQLSELQAAFDYGQRECVIATDRAINAEAEVGALRRALDAARDEAAQTSMLLASLRQGAAARPHEPSQETS